MEDVRPEPEDALWSDASGGALHRRPEPLVRLVLAALLAFCIVFSVLGGALFQLIYQLAGWNTEVMAGVLAADAPPAERWQMRLLVGLSHFSTFFLAGWVTVRLLYPPASNALAYLRTLRAPPLRPLLGATLLMVVAAPLVLFTFNLNQAFPLPDVLRQMEEQANESIKGLLQMDNGLELVANLLIIAVLPALGEELVFRGIVQKQLLRRIQSPWLAIVLTALIFSFIHFQFEGFLPRVVLGVLLGWLYWRTNNLWVPVAAHFVNNGIQVMAQFLYAHEVSTVDLESDVEVPWYAAALSLALVFALMQWIAAHYRSGDGELLE